MTTSNGKKTKILKHDLISGYLNACRKEKDKTEKFELDKAIKRAKEAGLL